MLLSRYRSSFVVPCSRSRSRKAQQKRIGQDSSLLMLNQALASLTRPEPPCQQQLLIVHREQFCFISIRIANSSSNIINIEKKKRYKTAYVCQARVIAICPLLSCQFSFSVPSSDTCLFSFSVPSSDACLFSFSSSSAFPSSSSRSTFSSTRNLQYQT